MWWCIQICKFFLVQYGLWGDILLFKKDSKEDSKRCRLVSHLQLWKGDWANFPGSHFQPCEEPGGDWEQPVQSWVASHDEPTPPSSSTMRGLAMKASGLTLTRTKSSSFLVAIWMRYGLGGGIIWWTVALQVGVSNHKKIQVVAGYLWWHWRSNTGFNAFLKVCIYDPDDGMEVCG